MDLTTLKPTIKLTIENPAAQTASQFGPGIAALCRGVRDIGSLNAAAKEMSMAYSKAWRIIRDTEAALGFQMLVRDGAHGSTLTPECAELLDIYDKLAAATMERCEQEYRKLAS